MMGANESQAEGGDGDKSLHPVRVFLRRPTSGCEMARLKRTPPGTPLHLPLPFAILDACFAMEIRNTLT